MIRLHYLLLELPLLLALTPAWGNDAMALPAGPSDEEIVMRDLLVIPPVGRAGRAPLHTDAIEALIVRGKWRRPQPGDEIRLPDGSTKAWESASAGEDGTFQHPSLQGGYVSWSVALDRPRILLLAAAGHSVVYVNGVPRGGDPYSTGWALHPVQLHKGMNELLFSCRRGRLRAKLTVPRAPVQFNTREATLPDLIIGRDSAPWGAVLIVNATPQPVAGWTLRARVSGGEAITGDLPLIPPLCSRKVAFRIPAGTDEESERADLELSLHDDQAPDGVVDQTTLSLRRRRPDQVQKRTFISDIDGSIQYYAVNPARSAEGEARPAALVLTLHGAGVEAVGQARSYARKSWCHIVAPTNRRPYGFDWEDWGRLDALEVLQEAQAAFPVDPARIYLTGHSMGGHGVWQVGVQYPDLFAALGPSAGWISFWSYAGSRREADPSPIEELIQRAASPSDTLALESNYTPLGIYILHGGKDDNVPPSEARTMVERLGKFHRDFVYHEQPGAGHWWNTSDEPGTDCVDWPAMFDLFARHTRPPEESVREVTFATANPAISAHCRWLTIEAQEHPLAISKAVVHADPVRRRFTGTTENVTRLSLRTSPLLAGGPIKVTLDGQTIEEIPWPGGLSAAPGGSIELALRQGVWRAVDPPSPSLKGPQRYGPFKQAFRHHVMFVYATRGTAEESRWAFNKARFDAETFWYRGNASVDLVADVAFDPAAEPDRNVILYGHSESNAAWDALLAESPVRIGRGELCVAEHVLARNDLACLFIRPRPGSSTGLVGVVGGTGPAGSRLTDRMPYFVSGVAYPDLIVLGPEALDQSAAGVLAAGFFGEDWKVETGDIAWKE